ncbi:MAG: hypothetical protein H6745_07155 [Deltaproteobacteria bacterium]|nr:hypothetical protein [Deltaproteobacteria bacterium]
MSLLRARWTRGRLALALALALALPLAAGSGCGYDVVRFADPPTEARDALDVAADEGDSGPEDVAASDGLGEDGADATSGPP